MSGMPQDLLPAQYRWRARLTQVLLNAGTPRRTAAAFAYGVFLSFSPFLGFQIALGLGVAFALRWSKVAVFAGLCTNLPWIMVPWYTFTTFVGATILGRPITAGIGDSLSALLQLPVYSAAFWTEALHIVAPFFWSFVIGSTACAVVVGVLAYLSVSRIIAAAQPADAHHGP